MSVCIDTRKAHLVRQHGDIIAIYTWVNGERAMVLLPAHRKSAGWYVIPDSSAWQYDNDDYLLRQSAVACDVMGFGLSAPTAFRIANIIIEGLEDLVRMPHEPPDIVEVAARHALGEMHLKADGELIRSEEIVAPAGAGQRFESGACA